MAYVLNNGCALTDLQDDRFVTHSGFSVKESQVCVCVCPEKMAREHFQLNSGNMRMKVMEITRGYIKATFRMQCHLLSIFHLYGLFNC